MLMVWPFTERFNALPAPMTAAAFFSCSAEYPSTFVLSSMTTDTGPQSAAAGLAGASSRMKEKISPKNRRRDGDEGHEAQRLTLHHGGGTSSFEQPRSEALTSDRDAGTQYAFLGPFVPNGSMFFKTVPPPIGNLFYSYQIRLTEIELPPR